MIELPIKNTIYFFLHCLKSIRYLVFVILRNYFSNPPLPLVERNQLRLMLKEARVRSSPKGVRRENLLRLDPTKIISVAIPQQKSSRSLKRDVMQPTTTLYQLVEDRIYLIEKHIWKKYKCSKNTKVTWELTCLYSREFKLTVTLNYA